MLAEAGHDKPAACHSLPGFVKNAISEVDLFLINPDGKPLALQIGRQPRDKCFIVGRVAEQHVKRRMLSHFELRR